MAEIHYLISDASKKVDVEAHVLRYWEEELQLSIPRNDMGHRYYTDFHIRLFRQIKMLKEKGYQLKAIKAALAKTLADQKIIPGELLEADVLESLKETGIGDQEMNMQNEDSAKQEGREEKENGQASEENGKGLAALNQGGIEELLAGKKMEQFQRLMNHIIGRAVEENSEKLSQDISYLVHDKLAKEMEYLMRVSDEREEERFKQLDEAIRAYQRDTQGRAEAAASFSSFPFLRLKKKKFGRNGNKL